MNRDSIYDAVLQYHKCLLNRKNMHSHTQRKKAIIGTTHVVCLLHINLAVFHLPLQYDTLKKLDRWC